MEHREAFYVILMNRANQVLGVKRISEGGVAGCTADGKMIFQAALLANASAIVLAHNHPSGNLRPSDADIKLTKNLRIFGDCIDLKILDHLIITSDNYYSFMDEGEMF